MQTMKTITSTIRNILISVILLNGIYQVIHADPFIGIMCTISGCYDYINAPSQNGLCTGGTKDLYATYPKSVIPCYGSRQWYTLLYGWICVGTMCHQGWYPAAIDGATSNMYTVTAKGKYWCTVDCGSGPYNTDTVEFMYDTAIPTISNHPQNQTICEGTMASFSVTASANYLKYSWQKMVPLGSWTIISGTTSSSYSYTPPAGDDLSHFRGAVSNGCGTAYSNEAILDIIFPPDITSNPADATICQESNASFSIYASGDVSTNSWEYSTNNVNYNTVPAQAPFSGTGTSQLTLTNTGLSYNNYYFRCKVTNSCSVSDYSTGAMLTVQARLAVNSAPSGNYYVCDGSNASFSVSYSGTSPISVQWQEYINGWSNLTGQTSSSLTFPVSLSMNNRQYRAVLTQANACNTTINTTAGTLLVNALPKIEIQPQSQEKCKGDNATFSVTGSGAGVSYQWQISRNSGVKWSKLYNGGHYSGVTTNNLVVSNLQDSINGYQFRCQAGGTCTPAVTSNTVNLIVDFPPTINSIDQNQVKCIGQSVTINSFASGTAPLSYKWRKDGVSITDWTSLSQYTIPAVGSLDAGKYDYLVTNICSTTGVESDDVTLTVNTPPSVNIQPSSVTICEASPMPTVRFTANVSGGTSLLWQNSSDNGVSWTNLVNNAIYSGVTTNELTVTNPVIGMNLNQFRCQVMGSCDPPVSTNAALLTIKTIPVITIQPRNDTVCFGTSATFAVTASSNIPMEYKWKQGGQGITDWLSFNTLVIDEVTLDNEDNYHVMVRNECAYNTPVNSELAYLKVLPPPNVSLGTDRHVCPGSSVLLDPGQNYASYSWSTGATTRAIEVTEQGNYTLNVTDENGCTSNDKVYVYMDPSIPEFDFGFESSRYCKGESVVLDATDQYDYYEWNTGSTSRTIQATKTGTYKVTAWNSNSVCKETDSVNITIAEPYDKEAICLLTIDLPTSKNLIVWEKTSDMGTQSYRIHRQTNVAGQYELIGEVPFTSLSVFVDEIADPEQRQWVYKITAVDTCGNESDYLVSPFHRPLFLHYIGTDNGVILEWEPYVVEGKEMEFLTYYIYRGTDSTDLAKFDEISADLFVYKDTDPNALINKYYYRIAGVKADTCAPTGTKKADSGPYSQSMSNLEDNRFLVGLNKIKSAEGLKIYPNPFVDYTTIVFPNPDHSKYQLSVRDITGKLVVMISNITEEKFLLERGNLKAGYYSVEIVGDRIYRGKVILE